MQCHLIRKRKQTFVHGSLLGTRPRPHVNLTQDLVALSLLNPTGKHSPEEEEESGTPRGCRSHLRRWKTQEGE